MKEFHREALNHSVSEEQLNQFAQAKINKGTLFIWEDEGVPVALTAATRPTLSGIAINSVYTPPEFRKKGYASNLVAHVSQLMLEKGYQYCTLFTDKANPTSNKIYQEIGYREVTEFREVIFAQ